MSGRAGQAPEEPFHNYFNYFTEIEEHFQRARGTSLFLLSPLDWALIETWKNSGIPLEAVLRGIDEAFEKWRSKKSRIRMVNSLAYCSQAVIENAQRMADGGRETKPQADAAESAFPPDALRAYLENAASELKKASASLDLSGVPGSLDQIIANLPELSGDLEALEQHLGILEQKMIAAVRAAETEEDALRTRRELDTYLRPWKSKMSAPQLSMLEKQYLERALLESSGLPRLSLFYFR
jgi:hypothetical protein